MAKPAHPRRIALAVASVAALIGGVLATTLPAAAHPRTPTAAAARSTSSAPAKAHLPKIKHVWTIVLENTNFNYTFGAKGHKVAPYLSKVMPAHGALLTHYYGIGHDSLDNYTAMVSGQSGNYELNQDCGRYEPFIQFGGENYDKFTKYGQLSGEGCVYPDYIKTVGTQLTHHGLTWRAYEQDMGNIPSRDKTVETSNGPACGHPALGGKDLTDSTGPAKDSYATRHDPFMYFASITDNPAFCDAHVLSLHPLKTDLKKISTTPNYSFITPNTCADAHDTPHCQDGSKGGLQRANQFLKKWVGKITASPAYKKNGMIEVMFDESGSDEDAGACCGEKVSTGYDDPSHPNMNEVGLYGPGGGRVGAVLLSKFIKPGTVTNQGYNHFSQLKSVEDIFGLAHLGDAKQPQVHAYGPDVFTRSGG